MNKGVTIDGKLIRFKRRERTKDVAIGKKASKGKPHPKSTKGKVVKISTAKTEKTGKDVKASETTKAAEPIKPAVESKEVEAVKPTVTN
ncbi:MAG: hypothetical protein ABSD96_13865 [Candidatus Korobacteraceae bacterium]|jgi:hypothetical protein